MPEPSSRPAVHFVTLGCPKNEVDSDRMAADLVASGFDIADDLDKASVVVVNTCGFIQDAVQESVDVALELADWRDAVPGRRLVLTGCMVTRYGTELADALTEPDSFVPVAEESGLPAELARLLGVQTDASTTHEPRLAVEPSAYLQISDGCHRSCAYCTIPSIRGPYRSRALAEIVAEARFLASAGAREVVLIGQDISAYGRDLETTDALPDVVRAVASVEDVRWLRLMYIQPDGVSDGLIEAIATLPEVCHYVDIPLQHASEHVLRAMRRRGSAEEFLGMIERLRTAVPDIVLRTTLIAGFPGETPADMRILEDFLEKARFDYVGVFPYSPEEGTAAATMDGLPTKRTRVRRAQRLRDLADRIGVEKVTRHVGSVLTVLSEGVDADGQPVGRWAGQAPEIDGVVLLDREVPAGEFVQVRVVDTLGYDLEGEVL